ncbi:DUF4870 domain-containing protein [Haloarchaeobius sp. TZWSO28]|uniref:DUF4870 domain-containing protein n=1 Tax=Haloarchaeobius sp. TZWSO28 TaxID=3446119 RepID=UPI003EBC040E
MAIETGDSSSRTFGGIVVHVLGLVFGVIAVVPAYLLSSAEFSKANARNALNWQLFFLVALLVLLVVVFFVGSSLVTVVAGFLILALYALDFGCCLYAAYQATTGETWTYPFAPQLV